ncbi:MAG: hypothetical protein L0387_26285 [Acidobacteria bacterium]|nr:hypothetical protein [Acidobacteriota bacterium]MCI0625111.1 hypothetical protein [Acidobacteriota bacterium]MCI0724531.1 hypothetical protein [Acidobacteriota bacterium]
MQPALDDQCVHLFASAAVQGNAPVDPGKFIGGNGAVGAERIDVDISTVGRQVANLFRPLDAEGQVDGGDHVLDARLLLLVPAGTQRAPSESDAPITSPPPARAHATFWLVTYPFG